MIPKISMTRLKFRKKILGRNFAVIGIENPRQSIVDLYLELSACANWDQRLGAKQPPFSPPYNPSDVTPPGYDCYLLA